MQDPRVQRLVRNFPENGIRFLLENPKNVRDLLGLADPDVTGALDLGHLTRLEGTFVKRDFRCVESDVLLRAPLLVRGTGEKNVWIYILIEHQSEPDPWMPLRLLDYVLEIYRIQEREARRRHGRRMQPALEPVLPVVFYTGTRRWDDVGTLRDLVPAAERIAVDIPTLRPLYLNLSALDADVLETGGGYLGWVLRLVQARKRPPAKFRRLVARVVRRLEAIPPADEARWRELLVYIHALIYNARHPAEQPDLQREIEASVPAGVRQREVSHMGRTIAEDLIERGRAEGERKTARATLIRLLRVRFGELPDDVVAIVEACDDLERLNTWLDRVVTAATLDDVGITG